MSMFGFDPLWLKGKERKEIHDREKAIQEVVYEVVGNIMYYCMSSTDDVVKCIVQHVEELNSKPLFFYMTVEVGEIYESLSDEDYVRVAPMVRETLLEYARRLCNAHRRRRQEKGPEAGDDACSSL